MRDSIPFQTKMRTASQRNHVPLQTESRPASSGITGPLRPEYADSEILRGTPIIKGTRIPLYDVVSLIDSGTNIEEILEIYPRLKKSQIGLASIYAKANPQRGRPKSRTFPKSLEISMSKKCLRNASVGG